MNQTPNYNFNVPVGSDVVNPLVQDFPNWSNLDTILRNIANSGITTATHTKTGTIHTLTFSETTVPMIRFQATADFNTNDTFTVNGVSVSALTVAGESLPDGAFVIGSMVLCELRDNLLTVYSSGSDASTLEGHPASYFASASDLQTVDDKADANKVLIDNLEAAIKYSNLGTALGTNYIQLPSNWEKLHIVVALTGTDKIPLEILRDDVSASENNYFEVGYYMDGTHFARVVVQTTTDNKVTLASCFYNSSVNVADQKYFAVKYR